ncbi:MAG: branched-chain amino acid ABC transporter ATP-binding protein/permease [Bacillati bacterium ANGP1]|uniref:Branched-chain amino acid ABC transporter ATP-binding protein/permease n=1 Tax=Candidatus Segetimicrobium genomatis TaxID=2569760 RepID=A0A537JUM5_9BACT|nr:MAG: branched-chain amino acid ABC transporter ATP-binding protein/permease [Terrabacteria group bacterium ANGP1]
MSSGVMYYLTTVLVYAGVDIMACIALNLQFGVAGLVNFGFILFQAAGAYAAAVLSMPPEAANGGFQQYVLGLRLPFPLPWLGGAAAGGLLAVPIGLVVLRRLRSDYQAIALLVISVIANTMITNVRPFLNGAAGLSLVPPPLGDLVNANSAGYQWLYVGLTALGCGVVLAAATRIVESPFGRTLRAMREREPAAAALGKNLVMLKMVMFIAGGVIAGLSGAVLVGFIGVWAPATWLYPETIVLFAALIVGGRGNNLGALLGALLVPVGFEEVTRFIPQVGPPGLIPALQWVAIGLLIIGFLWFRPRGTLPERRRVFADPPPAGTPNQSESNSRQMLPPSDRSRPLLAAEGVKRRFEGLRAVDGVSLEVVPGRITGLIGPNGAGKSTLLAVLAGTLPASAGRILLGGADVTRLPAYRRAQWGLVRTFQLSSEFAQLTVLENLLVAVPRHRGDSLAGALRGKAYWWADERPAVLRARALLARFGMSAQESEYAGTLSGGQKRLVEIMRALMLGPRVLLLDEPMAGVHPSLVEEIAACLERLRDEGLAILMVEHELSMVDRLCDPVIVMAQGQVIGRGSMTVLRRQREIVDAYLAG